MRSVLLGPGEGSVRLSDAAPASVRRKPYRLDHVAVTPTRIQTYGMTVSQLLAQARYTFRVDEMTDRLEFAGPGLMGWLGDGDPSPKGVGHNFPFGPPAATATQIVNDAFDPIYATAAGLTKGTAYGSSAISVSQSYPGGTSLRAAMLLFNEAIGEEFRVNPNGVFDWGQPGSLWRSGANINLLISATSTGDDVDIKGLQVIGGLSVRESARQFAKVAIVTDGTFTTAVYGFGGTTGVDGQLASIRKIVRVGDAHTANDSAVPKMSTTILAAVATPDIGRYLTQGQPGDYVYLWDPERGITDLAVQRTYRGEIIFPVANQRVLEVEAPFTRGMGVYHMATNDDPNTFTPSMAITDWSDWVEWEDPVARLVLGAQPQNSLRQSIAG